MRRLFRTGLLATLAAMLVVALTAALAYAVGVDFEVPGGGEAIPVAGFATLIGLPLLAARIVVPPLARALSYGDGAGPQVEPAPTRRWVSPR